MKMTLSALTILVIVVGFALVGDALAQPDSPSPAASETSGDGAAAGEAKPEDKPDETSPSESEPSKPDAADSEEKEEAKEEGSSEADPAPEGALDQGKGLFSAVKGGQWMLAFGFAAMLIGSILRWAMKFKWKFWEGKTGGYVIAGITGLATLGTSIVTSGAFSMDGLMVAATVTLTAMGMHGPAKAMKNKLKPAS